MTEVTAELERELLRRIGRKKKKKKTMYLYKRAGSTGPESSSLDMKAAVCR